MLKQKEELIMEILWEHGKPMTSMEIVASVPPKTWGDKSDKNVHRIINSLIKKDMLEVCGKVLSGKQYARLFRPTISLERYTLQIYTKKNLNSHSLAEIALGLSKAAKEKEEVEDPIDDETIEKLKEMVEEFQRSNDT